MYDDVSGIETQDDWVGIELGDAGYQKCKQVKMSITWDLPVQGRLRRNFGRL